jgi:nitrogenase molybdenum-iron protein beta chain
MTTTVIKQKRTVAINPIRACAPIGAMMATFGIHGALTINHGSQGCATYPRHQMARHFREPIEVATTSLSENTTIYGGRENLVAGLKNLYERFHPTMITVCSTCLSETIGDDIPAFIDEFLDNNPEVDIPILSVRTPSYVGTHITGFDNFLKELALKLPKKGRPNGKVNVIPGWVNPGDLREIKHILREMDIPSLVLTDYSDTLDGGLYSPKPHFPRGGNTLDEIRDSANAKGTIAIQKHIGGEAARVYKKRFGIPEYVLPMPIGIANTDKFIETLTTITGKPIGEEVEAERARLLDALMDTHMFTTGVKVAIFGDPDLVEGLVRLVAEMGMEPKYVLTATDSQAWSNDLMKLSDELGLDMEILVKSDLYALQQKMKAHPVDLLIGHSKGKYIADDENIPIIRVGFPVEDRYGYHRKSVVGYRGAISLVDEITNAVLEKKGAVISNTLLLEGNC